MSYVQKKSKRQTQKGLPGRARSPLSVLSRSKLSWPERAYEALVLAFTRAPGRIQSLIRLGRKEFLDVYGKRHTEGTAASWLKFHSACLFAKAMDQTECPMSPDGKVVPDSALIAARGTGRDVHGEREDDGCFCPGKVQTACKAIMKLSLSTRKRRWRDVAYDVLMFKVGCPPVDQRFVDASYKKHEAALSVEHPPNNVEAREKVKKEIKFLVQQVFAPLKIRKGHLKPKNVCLHLPDLCPSFRSCYETPIKEGGAFRDLWDAFYQDRGFSDAVCESLQPSALVAMTEVAPGEILETRLPDRSSLVDAFHQWVDAQCASRLSSPLDASPYAILEPLKVRMITKGQSAEYYRCLDYQKMMHRALRRHGIFSCIGKPLDDAEWERAFGAYGSALDMGVVRMVSGDYDAATDSLDPEVSVFCWDQICRACVRMDGTCLRFDADGNDSYEYALGRKALVGHRLHYPNGVVVEQKWGQLMGSPMSFPILCLINAACCRLAIGLNKLEGPLRINGDDCCFPALEEEISEWETLIASVGLKKSVGKNYVSSRFAIMNSELRVRVKGKWQYEGWLNQSLLTGVERKGMNAGKPANISFLDVGTNLRCTLEGILERHHEKIVGLGISYHRTILDQAPRLCSWWVPRELGGLGLPCVSVEEKVRGEPYELERRVISAYVCSAPLIASRLPRTTVLKGPVQRMMDCLKTEVPSSWRSHAAVYAHPSLARRAELSGVWMLGQLSRIPGSVDNWEPLEGTVSSWKLRKTWEKWVAPAIEIVRSFSRRTAKGEPASLVIEPMGYDKPFPVYPWTDVVQFPSEKGSRERRVRCGLEPVRSVEDVGLGLGPLLFLGEGLSGR